MELGLCQGKHVYDKKKATMEKDIKREQERAIKNYRQIKEQKNGKQEEN